MITGIILSFFGASCLASVIVFAACAASARADRIQHHTFSDEAEQATLEKRKKSVGNTQLALNP